MYLDSVSSCATLNLWNHVFLNSRLSVSISKIPPYPCGGPVGRPICMIDNLLNAKEQLFPPPPRTRTTFTACWLRKPAGGEGGQPWPSTHMDHHPCVVSRTNRRSERKYIRYSESLASVLLIRIIVIRILIQDLRKYVKDRIRLRIQTELWYGSGSSATFDTDTQY